MKNYFVFLVFSILLCCSPTEVEENNDFAIPDPESYVRLMPYVREYFHLRKQAVINGNLNAFYERYPDLGKSSDRDQGINTEAYHVRNMQSLEPFDGNFFPEYYEKIKIHEMDGAVHVLVHGMEIYLWKNDKGMIDESGGEFKMVISLSKVGETWEIYETDEVTLREWKE